jgi:hypothetical protein
MDVEERAKRSYRHKRQRDGKHEKSKRVVQKDGKKSIHPVRVRVRVRVRVQPNEKHRYRRDTMISDFPATVSSAFVCEGEENT